MSVPPGRLVREMTDEMSPAERYAASRRRAEENATALAQFRELYEFGLDPFQIDACRALEGGSGVLVAAPTGSGKTIVGEFAVHLALAEGRKCFYTTPIKALSNQKYNDLAKRYGADKVGLLTGDNSVNGDAPVIVMTTEVLRNMLYAGSPALDGLGYVVMDEVHYLSDRFRGAVWEEVIIHLPQSVTLVSLSATVSNAEEFGDWLDTVRGDTKVIVSEHRPVPLWQHVLAGRRMYDLFEEKSGPADPGGRREVNTDLERLARMENQRTYPRGKRGREADRERERRSRSRIWTPSRAEVIDRLDNEGLLPAITFIFSRAGCEAAVQQCLYAGLRLNNDEARARVRSIVEERTRAIPDEDLHVLGYFEWLEGLERGIAAHHAGMLPTFKEVVEELFVKGLVKAVFATETLALGINMPARSVVLEKLVKWNGETHADITPGEYTQLTGRAGRRGIDVEGHAVVLWQRGFDPTAVAGLAGTRTYPLRSSFKPSYNMAVNLVGQFGRHRSRELLETSFAQFQADRSVVGISRQVQRNEEGLDGYQESMTCHLGDFDAYMRLRRELKEREAELSRQGAAQRRAAASDALEKLKPGDIIHVPAGKYAGLALVLDPGCPPGGPPAPGAARSTTTGRARWCSPPNARSSGWRRWTSRCPSRRWTGCASPSRSTRAARSPGATSPRRCAPRPAPPAGRRRPGTASSVRPPPTTPRSPGCAARSARIPATAAPTVRTTPGGPSGTTDCAATPSSWRGGSKAVPTPSRGPSTGSARCWPSWTTSTATPSPPRAPAGPALRRTRPVGQRMPAGRRVGRPRPSRTRRVRLGVGLRVPAVRRRRDAETPDRQREGGARRDGADLGPAGRVGGGPPDQPDRGRGPARARPRLRVARVPLGVRPRPGRGALRRRHARGGLRALVQAAHRRAGPDRQRGARGQPGAAQRPQGGGRAAARRGGVLLGRVNFATPC